MVLVHRAKAGTAWLDTIQASQLFFGGEGDVALRNGTTVRRSQRVLTQAEINSAPPAKQSVGRRWFNPRQRQEHAPL